MLTAYKLADTSEEHLEEKFEETTGKLRAEVLPMPFLFNFGQFLVSRSQCPDDRSCPKSLTLTLSLSPPLPR